MKMEERKIKLLKEIGYWYGAQFIIGNKIYCADKYYESYNYNTVNEALKDWLDTLIESNQELTNKGLELLWSKEEIDLIKNL